MRWIKQLFYKMFYKKCPKCGEQGLYFHHEEHFEAGSPDVYHCKFCKKWII